MYITSILDKIHCVIKAPHIQSWIFLLLKIFPTNQAICLLHVIWAPIAVGGLCSSWPNWSVTLLCSIGSSPPQAALGGSLRQGNQATWGRGNRIRDIDYDTAWFCNNMVNFLQNAGNTYPIAYMDLDVRCSWKAIKLKSPTHSLQHEDDMLLCIQFSVEIQCSSVMTYSRVPTRQANVKKKLKY